MADDPMADFLRRLVKVPKDEIDEQERLYQEAEAHRAKPGGMVPREGPEDKPAPH